MRSRRPNGSHRGLSSELGSKSGAGLTEPDAINGSAALVRSAATAAANGSKSGRARVREAMHVGRESDAAWEQKGEAVRIYLLDVTSM
jgi:hypothetical protein